MYVSFEIAALFPSLYSRVKSAEISKQTFIWTPSSLSYIILALSSLNLVSRRIKAVLAVLFCINKIKAKIGSRVGNSFILSKPR